MAVILFVAQHAGLFLAAPFVLVPLSVLCVHARFRGAVAVGLVLFSCGALAIILFLASMPYI
jgi:hypothetical protein